MPASPNPGGSRLRILFAHSRPLHPQRGGVERVTDILARNLKQRGHEIFYLTLNSPANYEGYTPPADVRFLPNTPLNSPENVQFYHNLLQEERIDVVINQLGLWAESALFTRFPRNATGRPICISVPHSLPLLEYDCLFTRRFRREGVGKLFFHLPRTLQRLQTYPRYKKPYNEKRIHDLASVIRSSDAFIPLASQHLATLESLGLLSDTRCHMRCISNPSTFLPLREVPPKKKQLLYVGRLEAEHKAAWRLIPIWKRLCHRHPDWELIIVGDGSLRPAMERSAASLPRIRFEGRQDPRPHLQDAAILCLTSDLEGFPMVIIEAMSYGVIPFAFNSFPALQDIVQDKLEELSATPFNLQEYADKLSRLMAHEERRQQLSRAFLAQADRYSAATITDQWEDLFEYLMRKA